MQKTTSLAIMTAVLIHMDAYQQNSDPKNTNELPNELQLVATYQKTIGQRSFGEGLISRHWQTVQREHCRLKGGHETSKRWVSKLIQHIWEISWTMWETRNHEIHNDAKVRRELYSGGIMSKIQSLKMQAQFCFCLSQDETKFFQTNIDILKKKRERNQLDWIARAEQFLDSDRISKRITTPRGGLYRWLAGTNPRHRTGQQSITDHMPRIRDEERERPTSPTNNNQRRDQVPIQDRREQNRVTRTRKQTTIDKHFTKRQTKRQRKI